MSLNVIDISSYQANLNLQTVFDQNPDLDAVIVKATEGTGYVNPYCDKFVQWLIKNNKPWGFYHYLSGTKNSGVEEAQYFVKHCANYFGDGIPVADVEAQAVNRGPGYLKEFLDEVFRMTGVKPLVYASLSVIRGWGYDADPIVDNGYKLWLAQYASATAKVYGFKNTPWQSGSVAPWPIITMHQYTDHGRLNGYMDDLDFSIFYGTKDDWYELRKSSTKPTPTPTPEPTPEPEPEPDTPTDEDPRFKKIRMLIQEAMTILEEIEADR